MVITDTFANELVGLNIPATLVLKTIFKLVCNEDYLDKSGIKGVDFATLTVPVYKLLVDIKFKSDEPRILGVPCSSWLNGGIRSCISSWVNTFHGICLAR